MEVTVMVRRTKGLMIGLAVVSCIALGSANAVHAQQFGASNPTGPSVPLGGQVDGAPTFQSLIPGVQARTPGVAPAVPAVQASVPTFQSVPGVQAAAPGVRGAGPIPQVAAQVPVRTLPRTGDGSTAPEQPWSSAALLAGLIGLLAVVRATSSKATDHAAEAQSAV